MRLRRLRLTNFRQHADTVIEFGDGLIGIIGPNGAGKSTLLEAVAWVMYGTPAARGTRESIRRRGAPARSRVEVELEFVLGAHRYRVTRSLQNAELYQDDEPTPIANSIGAVTERVTRLLGMSRDEFFSTYFTGQKELAIMASMGAPARAQFLSQVLGYERLRTVQVRLKEERTALRAALQVAESSVIDAATLAAEEAAADHRLAKAKADGKQARADHQAAQTRLTAMAPEWERVQQLQDRVRSLQSDLQVAQHRAAETRRSFESLDRDLAEALAAKSREEELSPRLAPWTALVERRDVLDAAAQAFAGRRAVEAQLKEVRALVEAQDKRLGQLARADAVEVERAQLTAVQGELEAAAQTLEASRTAWVQDRQEAETHAKTLGERLAELRLQYKTVRNAGPNGTCPTCGRTLGKDFQSVLEDLERQGDEVNFNKQYYESRIKQLAKEPEDLVRERQDQAAREARVKQLTSAVARLETQLADRSRVERERAAQAKRLAELEERLRKTPTSYDEAEHRAVRQQLAELEPLREEIVRLKTKAERAALLVPKAAQAEQELSRAEAEMVRLTEQLDGLGWSVEFYEQTHQGYLEADRARQAAEVALARAEADWRSATEHRAALTRRRQEREERAAEVERIGGDLLLNQELDRAFSDLRDELNAALRPDLSEIASTLLRDLTTGRYVDLELDDDYVARIVEDGETKTVISGGEEDVVNLALRLAISQMIAERAGQPFSLLILDEVFGSLDEDRRNSVVNLLRGLADRFPQVILITHIESVRESFDRVIRIEYDVERGTATARDEQPSETADAAA